MDGRLCDHKGKRMSYTLDKLTAYADSLRASIAQVEMKGGHRRVMLTWISQIENLARELDDPWEREED